MTHTNTEKKALRAVAMQAAFNEGIPLMVWLDAHHIARNTFYSDSRPSFATLYRVCNGAGIKPSEFFASIGK